jgi:hypothetical protein
MFDRSTGRCPHNVPDARSLRIKQHNRPQPEMVAPWPVAVYCGLPHPGDKIKRLLHYPSTSLQRLSHGGGRLGQRLLAYKGPACANELSSAVMGQPNAGVS